ELDELAVTFNEAFARLAGSVGEMKQLTASMAHELRTPLAALRGEAEIALLHEGSVDELKRVLSSQLEEIEKLTKLIDQLLMLTKAESGLLRLERKPVDIAALLQIGTAKSPEQPAGRNRKAYKAHRSVVDADQSRVRAFAIGAQTRRYCCVTSRSGRDSRRSRRGKGHNADV